MRADMVTSEAHAGCGMCGWYSLHTCELQDTHIYKGHTSPPPEEVSTAFRQLTSLQHIRAQLYAMGAHAYALLYIRAMATPFNWCNASHCVSEALRALTCVIVGTPFTYGAFKISFIHSFITTNRRGSNWGFSTRGTTFTRRVYIGCCESGNNPDSNACREFSHIRISEPLSRLKSVLSCDEAYCNTTHNEWTNAPYNWLFLKRASATTTITRIIEAMHA